MLNVYLGNGLLLLLGVSYSSLLRLQHQQPGLTKYKDKKLQTHQFPILSRRAAFPNGVDQC